MSAAKGGKVIWTKTKTNFINVIDQSAEFVEANSMEILKLIN